MSFNQAFTTHTPVPFPISGKALIAVFWADVQIGIAGDVWYRETTDINTLQRATTEIQSHFTYMSSFKASMVFIATWNDVAFYGADSQGRNKRNTFQVVLTTNGYVSFVIYNYNKIQWHTGTASGGNSSTGLGGTPAEVRLELKMYWVNQYLCW
ncbi:hypothetical protein KUTeg_005313 [Tegillarca granosa]|uniref:NIDO domain-containing protein n=1 Tax=Tegillarca granosa TaxID=220873 RepID=A0ABQ9FJE2_TEGGR|nr:hypothetical protein KUTeg_005313 [Tegillarca granosa]